MIRENIDRNLLDIEINRRGGIIDSDPVFTGGTPPDDDAFPLVVVATNLIDNSDFDFSKDDYLNNPAVGGDPSYEAYNWYRQRLIRITDAEVDASSTTLTASTSTPFQASYSYPMNFLIPGAGPSEAALSGTLTRVDNSTATLSVAADKSVSGALMWFGDALEETSAKALKGDASHSLWSGNEDTNTGIPRWDRTNGWVEIGTSTNDTWDVACPLPLNYVRGGVTLFFRCIVALRSEVTPDNSTFRITAGVWDATSGQDRFIEDSPFSLSVAPVGTTGSTTYKYKVIAITDTGMEFESDEVEITNGNATLSASNYNRLTWQSAPGILDFKIYREVSGVVNRVFTITNGTSGFNDTGGSETTEASMPVAANRRSMLYTESQLFQVTSSTAWMAALLSVKVPSGYNTANTTDRQWLRIGIRGTKPAARAVVLDRVMLSTSNGGWQRSSRDLTLVANRNPSSNPPETTQDDSGGGFKCFPLDERVTLQDGSQLPIGEVDKGMYLDSGGRKANRITKIKDSYADTLVHVLLSNGIKIRCTPSERWVTSRADKDGTRIDNLTLGDTILCKINDRVESATIESYVVERMKDPIPVRTLGLKPGHTFVVGGAIAHNLKNDPEIF